MTTVFKVVTPVMPDVMFMNLVVGDCFQTKYGSEVWFKMSAAYYQQIDNPARRFKQHDEREVVIRVLLEREDT